MSFCKTLFDKIYIIKIYINNLQNIEYKIVYLGDTSGDGKITQAELYKGLAERYKSDTLESDVANIFAARSPAFAPPLIATVATENASSTHIKGPPSLNNSIKLNPFSIFFSNLFSY